MSIARQIRQHKKRELCKKHRQLWYLQAINKVIDGKAEPQYATYRWKLLKEIR